MSIKKVNNKQQRSILRSQGQRNPDRNDVAPEEMLENS